MHLWSNLSAGSKFVQRPAVSLLSREGAPRVLSRRVTSALRRVAARVKMADHFRVAMGVWKTFMLFACVSDMVLAEAPQIVTVKSLDELEEGQRLLIGCAVRKGSLPISYSWRKNNAVLVPSSNVKILRFDEYQEQLQIQRLTHDDIGNYTCTAKNRHGSDQISVPVVMKYAPRWKIAHGDNHIRSVAGEKVSIDCRADGFPIPTVKIWKGQLIPVDMKDRLCGSKNRIVLDAYLSAADNRIAFWTSQPSVAVTNLRPKQIRESLQVTPTLCPWTVHI